MELDYITGYWLIFFLLLTPLLRTKTRLDCLIFYMWIYAVVYSKLPWGLSRYSRGVQLSIENQQNELLIMLGLLALLMKSTIDVKPFLRRFAYTVLFMSVLAIVINSSIYYVGDMDNPFVSWIVNNQRYVSGIVLNKSMNGILCAALLPFTNSLWALFGTVFVVALSKSSSAYLSLGGVLVYLLWEQTRAMRKWIWVAILISIFILWKVDASLFWGGQRWEGYKFFFNDFTWADWLIGKGPASFWSISTYRQAHENFEMANGFFFYMHSDLLQFIYEYGLLAIIPLGIAVSGFGRDLQARASIVAFILGGVFYYPFHFPVHIFALFMILQVGYGNGGSK